MGRVQIHCYGCDARTPVTDSHMEEDLRSSGWSVSHGETYCRACTARRAAEQPPATGEEDGVPAAYSPEPPVVADYSAPTGESRLARTLRLMGTSLRLLRRDPRLLIFPVAAIIVNLIVAAALIVLLLARSGGSSLGSSLVPWVIASFPMTFATIFCGVALACMLAAYLEGHPISIAGAFGAAWRRAGVIAAWTLVVCTVGLALRLLENWLPRFLVTILNLSFGLLTVFAVPILAFEQLGPVETFSRSRGLLRSRWPEQISGAIGIGIVGGLLVVPCILAVAFGVAIGGSFGIFLVIVGVLSLLTLMAAQAAAEQVFRVCLYRYAVGREEAASSPFALGDLQRPFGRRRRGLP